MDPYVVDGCCGPKIIYMNDCRTTCIPQMHAPINAKFGPPAGTMAGNTRVWDLRELKEVVIPEGVERIGNYWFYGCEVESVIIPASVKEIGARAFCKC